jgi:hypothetical protein
MVSAGHNSRQFERAIWACAFAHSRNRQNREILGQVSPVRVSDAPADSVGLLFGKRHVKISGFDLLLDRYEDRSR